MNVIPGPGCSSVVETPEPSTPEVERFVTEVQGIVNKYRRGAIGADETRDRILRAVEEHRQITLAAMRDPATPAAS